MADLRIHVDDHVLSAAWIDRNLRTRGAIDDSLPLAGDARRWGDELYFSVPIDESLEDGQQEVPVGAVAYWPQGNALCLFWGPTPASTGENPAAASPVSVVAIVDTVSPLQTVDGNAHVRVERGE